MKRLFKNNKFAYLVNLLPLPYGFDNPLVIGVGRRIYGIAKHPLISGVTAVFSGSLIGNVFHFLFNLFMTIQLSFSDYGILASMFSLMTLFSLPVGAIVPMLIYYFASYHAKGNSDMIRGLYRQVTKYAFLVGFIILVVFLVFHYQIGTFFQIENTPLIILVGLNTLIAFTGVGNQPLLQSQLFFPFIAFLNSFGSLLKLTVGVVGVLLGFPIETVLIALVLSTIIPYSVSFIPLKFLFSKGVGRSAISFKTLFKYGGSATIATFGLTSFITVDIVLVKHFFSSEQTGIYAVISVIGRVIYYFSAPISTVMFPLIVKKYTKGENYHKDFLLSLLLVAFPSFILIMFYIFFTDLVVTVLTRKSLDEGTSMLIIPFGIYTAFYAIVLLLTNFYLAINKTKVFIPILLGSLLQAVLIYIFHESFLQIILISLSIMSLLLCGLLLYYWKLYGAKTQ